MICTHVFSFGTACTDLFSFDQMAVKWGERLFEYFRNRAKPF
ncbi:MAG TPA: DUF1724 domain-containing protein [Methanosarcinaceae archaeon]|nr:DUF1724 domain-containing protein [Methanosarcinaceae archaeon]